MWDTMSSIYIVLLAFAWGVAIYALVALVFLNRRLKQENNRRQNKEQAYLRMDAWVKSILEHRPKTTKLEDEKAYQSLAESWRVNVS